MPGFLFKKRTEYGDPNVAVAEHGPAREADERAAAIQREIEALNDQETTRARLERECAAAEQALGSVSLEQCVAAADDESTGIREFQGRRRQVTEDHNHKRQELLLFVQRFGERQEAAERNRALHADWKQAKLTASKVAMAIRVRAILTAAGALLAAQEAAYQEADKHRSVIDPGDLYAGILPIDMTMWRIMVRDVGETAKRWFGGALPE